MNFSKLKRLIYGYLGYHGMGESAETDRLIESCLEELKGAAQFNFLYRAFKDPPEFLLKQPYADFLSGCGGVILSVTTLGAGVDMRIKRLSRTDMARSAVFDSCASAYLEFKSDEFESTLGDNLTSRFCPGYGGSGVEDLKYIFELLNPEKIGVTLNENFFMLPSKTMAGVIGIGKKKAKDCGDCVMIGHCGYREEGRRCFDSEREL